MIYTSYHNNEIKLYKPVGRYSGRRGFARYADARR